MSEHDPHPGLIADIDQAIRAHKDLARLCKGWFDGFREAGFTEEHSMQLTREQLRIFSEGIDPE